MAKYQVQRSLNLFRRNERATEQTKPFREAHQKAGDLRYPFVYVNVGPSCLGLEPRFQGEFPDRHRHRESRTAAIPLLCDDSNNKNRHSVSIHYYQLFLFYIACIH